LRGVSIFHGDKAETASAARSLVLDKVHSHNSAVSGESVLKIVLCGIVGKVSNVQFGTHILTSERNERLADYPEPFGKFESSQKKLPADDLTMPERHKQNS
jgi:hypothetical protein